MKEKAGRGLIVSLHDFDGMPDDLEGLYKAMCDDGADIVKLAVTPRSFADVVRILEFAGEVGRGWRRATDSDRAQSRRDRQRA